MITHFLKNGARLFCLGLCFSLAFPGIVMAAGGSSCGPGNTPAFSLSTNLHIPGVFRPATTNLTCEQVPAERDSSAWDSLSVPGFSSGNEIFQGLDVLDNHLYVAYNAGLSVWNIENPERPVRVAVADGWINQFFTYPPPGEVDFFNESIAVLRPSTGGSRVYIVVSAIGPVGTSIWEFNTTNEVLNQLYQYTATSRQVRIEEVGGTIYAFAGRENGVDIFNVSEAIAEAPCTDIAGDPSPCPSVFEGSLSTNSGGFIDILKKSSGAIYLSNSDGNIINSLGLELWQINNPGNPGGAIRRFSGLGTQTFGSALFEKGGNTYMAALERVGSNNRLKIWDIDACLTSNCGGSPGTLEFDSLPLPPFSTRQFLTYSEGGSTNVPFLHYGLRASSLSGDHVDQLLDLTTLGTANQNITEMTDGAPTYFDTCQSENLDYWSWYYAGNEFGTQNFTPRIGKFNEGTIYFYRANGATVDVHVWEGGSTGNPTITAEVSSPQVTYWMGESITFEASGATGCVPLSTGWSWDIDTPAGVSHIVTGQTNNQITASFSCDDATNRCADAAISATAENSASSCATAVLNAAEITVKDPRLEIIGLTPNGGTFPQCTVIDFEAQIAGRGPADYAWSVNGENEDSGTASEEDLSSISFSWDTTNVVLSDEIFLDGFESGDTTSWSSTVGGVSTLKVGSNKGVSGGAPFEIAVGIDSTFSDPVDTSTTVNITLLGTNLGFENGVDPIESTTMDSSTFDFHANSVDATEFRWEFEDSDGADVCTFGASTNVPCVRMNGGQDISYTWVLQAGTRRVNLTIASCVVSEEEMATTSVEVVLSETLEITDFGLVRSLATNPNCELSAAECIGLLGDPICECRDDLDVIFEVEALGSPTSFDVDWDGDGSFDENVPFAATITHQFPNPESTPFKPVIKARRGAAESDPVEGFEELIITN